MLPSNVVLQRDMAGASAPTANVQAPATFTPTPYEPQQGDGSTLPSTHVPTDVVLRALVEKRGHPRSTLERLAALGYTQLQPADLVDMVKDHLPELKAQMEVVATLELFSLMPVLSKTLTENLASLEPGEAVTAYMKLMELINKSVGTHDVNLNINDQRWRQVPRELQQVYAALEASGQLQQVIEHEAEGAA